MRRSQVPARQKGAVGTTLAHWEDLFSLLEAHPERWSSLRASTLLARREGRPRKPGEWSLAYLAFVNSGERELTRWLRSTPPELWVRAGFGDWRPAYQATYEAFAALEACEEAFREVAAAIVRLAVEASDGKVGHALHVDGTEAETHSRIIHDCQGKERASCKWEKAKATRGLTSEAREVRQRQAESTPVNDELFSSADEVAVDARGAIRLRIGGCWHKLSDGDAGVRAYNAPNGKTKKIWAGYYNLKATDHYTGGVLATYVCPANTQEYHAYPHLYERAKEAIGEAPKAVVADRGFSISAVFEMHTRDGVASVMPWRKHNHATERREHERFDRHGVPFCRHCGRETTFVRFQADTGQGEKKEPRLWFRCAFPTTEGCNSDQTIYCRENWRLLLPLWRTSEAYQVLRASHDNYEHAHHRWRERYGVAGDSRADRPKRRGLAVQQLRSTAALIIEWLTICHRQGWLPGSTKINTEPESRISREHASSFVTRIRDHRQKLGLGGTLTDRREDHASEMDAFAATSADGSRRAHATVMDRREEPE